MSMNGLTAATTTALSAAGLIPIAAALEPKDLAGLGPDALLAVIALAALGVAVYFVKTLAPSINANTTSNAIVAERISRLCEKMESNPCLAKTAEEYRREAQAVIDDAKREALNVDVAKRTALNVV